MKCVFFFKKERPEWESTQRQRTQETDCLPRKGVLRSRDLQRIRKQKLNIIYSLDPSWPFACLVCLSRSRLLSPPGSSTLLSGGWPPTQLSLVQWGGARRTGTGHNSHWAGPQGHCLKEESSTGHFLGWGGVSAPGTGWGKLNQARSLAGPPLKHRTVLLWKCLQGGRRHKTWFLW